MNTEYKELIATFSKLGETDKAIQIIKTIKEMQESFKNVLVEAGEDSNVLFDDKVGISSEDKIDLDSLYKLLVSLEDVMGRAINAVEGDE